jgi:putative flippase GtrA
MRSFLNREAFNQLMRVGVIGVVNTVVSFALFNLLLWVLEATGEEGNDAELFWATTISFVLATYMSYVLNRRWSFSLTEGRLSGRETVHFFVINLVALALTIGIVNGANALWGPLTQAWANVAYAVAALIIIVPKFAGYRDIVFRRALDERQAGPATQTVDRPG